MADPRLEELKQAIKAIRERVDARHPSGTVGRTRIELLDLTPLLHARDAAEAKVAAIGTVNPRPAGALNAVVQALKRGVARGLNWFVRDQVEFNRAAMDCVQQMLDALNEANRLAVDLGGRMDVLEQRIWAAEQTAGTLADVHTHWIEWRQEWEYKMAANEVQFLRAVADLEASYRQQVAQHEINLREQVRAQHAEFEGALERSTLDIQKRLWADLQNIRAEYERLIHGELRTVRQRAGALAPPGAAGVAAGQAECGYDALHFAARFRGPEEYVRGGFGAYVEEFAGCGNVLDIGCGRGEFLELMREAGIAAQGIDLDEEAVGICRGKGLAAERADLFTYLNALPEGALDGLFCAQVIEHLEPRRLPEFFGLAAAKLKRGGRLVVETPNPACLAIYATHFWLDPTHTRPAPAPLVEFYAQEAGFGEIRTVFRAPAEESIAAVRELPEGFRKEFFGALDYAVMARRL